MAGEGRGGVAVSDGHDVILTADDGGFALPGGAQAGPFCFITCPGDAWTDAFHRPLDGVLEFDLQPRQAEQHVGVYVTDIHLESAQDPPRRRFQDSLREIRDGAPAFVVFGGDICLQSDVGAGYAEDLASLGVPSRQAVGNHELVVAEPNPYERFESRFGPTYHSFDVGRIHYIVLRNALPAPWLRGYTNVVGGLSEAEWGWLKADLAAKEPGRPVVVFSHIPIVSTYCERRGTTAAEAPYWVMPDPDPLIDLLAVHDTRFVLQGHLHENERLVRRGIEFASTVSICGHWWRSPELPERGVGGEPRGYRRIVADGDVVRHEYVATAESATDAVAEVVEVSSDADATTVWVNVYDGGPATEVTVSGGGHEVAAELCPYPSTLMGEPLELPHHYRARLPRGSGDAPLVTTEDRATEDRVTVYSSPRRR